MHLQNKDRLHRYLQQIHLVGVTPFLKIHDIYMYMNVHNKESQGNDQPFLQF